MKFGIIYLKDFSKTALIKDAPEYKQGSFRGKILIFLVSLQKRGCGELKGFAREAAQEGDPGRHFSGVFDIL